MFLSHLLHTLLFREIIKSHSKCSLITLVYDVQYFSSEHNFAQFFYLKKTKKYLYLIRIDLYLQSYIAMENCPTSRVEMCCI